MYLLLQNSLCLFLLLDWRITCLLLNKCSPVSQDPTPPSCSDSWSTDMNLQWPSGLRNTWFNTFGQAQTVSSPLISTYSSTCSWGFSWPLCCDNAFVDFCCFMFIWRVFFLINLILLVSTTGVWWPWRYGPALFSLALLSLIQNIVGIQVCWIINKPRDTCFRLCSVMCFGMRVFLIETFGLLFSASEQVEQITVQSSVLFDIV